MLAAPSQSDADLWTDLCEKSDRTSPEVYPDMALITEAEFFDYLAAVRAEATLAEREACAQAAESCGPCDSPKSVTAAIRARSTP
jgi:hypothetical protein